MDANDQPSRFRAHHNRFAVIRVLMRASPIDVRLRLQLSLKFGRTAVARHALDANRNASIRSVAPAANESREVLHRKLEDHGSQNESASNPPPRR